MPTINETLQIVLAVLGIMCTIITIIVWLVRLEGKVGYVEKLADEAQKDVDVLRVKHEGLDNKIVEQLSDVKQSLARLEGRLGIIKEGD